MAVRHATMGRYCKFQGRKNVMFRAISKYRSRIIISWSIICVFLQTNLDTWLPGYIGHHVVMAKLLSQDLKAWSATQGTDHSWCQWAANNPSSLANEAAAVPTFIDTTQTSEGHWYKTPLWLQTGAWKCVVSVIYLFLLPSYIRNRIIFLIKLSTSNSIDNHVTAEHQWIMYFFFSIAIIRHSCFFNFLGVFPEVMP